jgi:hypothetical protein
MAAMRLLRVRTLSVMVALSLPLLNVYSEEPPLTLGVLEDIPGHYTGDPNFRAVRVLFRKDGVSWRAFPSKCLDSECLKTIASEYPHEVTWTIGFDGRILGQVTGSTPVAFAAYADVGLQTIADRKQLPTVGKRSPQYAGWLYQPVFRPLIASSQRHFTNPDAWKPSHLPAGVTAELRLKFRQKFPEVENCTKEKPGYSVPWRYGDENINLMSTYSSKTGWSVAQMALRPYRCNAPVDDDDAFGDQWFTISPRGDIGFLGRGMWLVDAGDYDNDGRSEIVFFIDRYNRGGYELFYDDFKGHAVFEFSYH